MNKNLSAIMNQQYYKGVQAGGLYWTCLMTIAIHNIYGWTSAFEKIEREMERLRENTYKGEISDYAYEVVRDVERIRGKGYLRDVKKQ